MKYLEQCVVWSKCCIRVCCYCCWSTGGQQSGCLLSVSLCQHSYTIILKLGGAGTLLIAFLGQKFCATGNIQLAPTSFSTRQRGMLTLDCVNIICSFSVLHFPCLLGMSTQIFDEFCLRAIKSSPPC